MTQDDGTGAPGRGRPVRGAPVGREPGAKAVVAVAGFSDPDDPCLPGELVLALAPCGRQQCSCGYGFHGVASHGAASVGRVVRLPGVADAELEAELVRAMRVHEGVEDAIAEAAAMLDEIGSIEEGRLVRREEGVILPFPLAARIEGPGRITYRPDDPA